MFEVWQLWAHSGHLGHFWMLWTLFDIFWHSGHFWAKELPNLKNSILNFFLDTLYITKYISVPPLTFPYHNQPFINLWNKDICTNLDGSLKGRMAWSIMLMHCTSSSSCSKEPPSKATQIPREWPKSSDWQALHSGLILSQLFQPKLLLFSFNPTIAVIFFFGFHFFLLPFFSSSPWSKLNIINHWHFFKTIFETFLVFLLLLCLQITLVRKIKFNCKLFFRERNSIQFGNSHKFKLLETCDKTATKADKKSWKGVVWIKKYSGS